MTTRYVGQRVARIPFEDYRSPRWWYNGEHTAAVADFDGDSREEFLLHTATGDFLLVGKD